MLTNDITFAEHLFKPHFDTKNNCNISLPKEGDTMTFYNYMSLLERPLIIYAEFESSSIPTGDEIQIHKHTVNSA